MQRITGRYAKAAFPRLGAYRLLDGRRWMHPSLRRLSDHNDADNASSMAALDAKWRKRWKRYEGKDAIERIVERFDFLPQPKEEKMYVLPMFPYPSGTLHMGHFRVYTISDVLSRFRRMQGYRVLHPIGWDAFGLPAENAARDRGLHPEQWTKRNIEEMSKQLELMNGQWNKSHEFATCDPSFYKHTQRLFLLLHERGLAYQAEAMVNYDPVDKTVLANEQVDANGRSWRSGAVVEKKMLKQWFFKISEFRQELLDDLEHLAKDGAWPERVLTMQRNWIGKSTGARVKFKISGAENSLSAVEVFTTRPDTLFGVQYLALSATHPLVKELSKTSEDLKVLVDDLHLIPPESKLGYLLPNIRAYSPLAEDESTPEYTKAGIPVYVAPYVLGDYGEGAVMGVPGHDARDFAFWEQNCPGEAVRAVIEPLKNTGQTSSELPFLAKGVLNSNNGAYAGLSSEEATKKLLSSLEAKGVGAGSDSWRLRDWLVSRQRYWGAPIPIVHCDSCGPVGVPVQDLPVELPKGDIDWTKSNGSELFTDPEWLNTSCPKCGGHAKRETDTMDTFVDSSWYFMRFPDSLNSKSPFSASAAKKFLPVDLYIGGVEHAILHLLYARFISKFLATTSLWPDGASPDVLGEPFKKVLTQGMVHGKTYSDPATGRFLKPHEVDLRHPAVPMVKSTGARAKITYEKMSKSKYNGVDPSTCVLKHGADVMRAHVLFSAPVSDVLEWDEEKISGVRRWLSRLFDFIISTRIHWQLLEIHPPPPAFGMLYVASERAEDTDIHMYLTEGQIVEVEHAVGKYKELPDGIKDVSAELRAQWRRTVEPDKKMWRAVQETIVSVTNAYGKTYSLNTVVSDLMTLTNTILDYHTAYLQREGKFFKENQAGSLSAGSHKAITYHSLLTLIKLMAPITPAISEELYEMMHLPRVRPEDAANHLLKSVLTLDFLKEKSPLEEHRPPLGSIFDQPFPEPDGSYEMLRPATRKCAVQVNGKLKCAVDIPQVPGALGGKELEQWITEEILKTDEGKEKLMGGCGDPLKGKVATGRPDIRKARKVIVVQGGKTVNYVV